MGKKLDYVNNAYGLDFAIGDRVLAINKLGVITMGTHHVWVRLDGDKHDNPYHPSDVKKAMKRGDVVYFDDDRMTFVEYIPPSGDGPLRAQCLCSRECDASDLMSESEYRESCDG